MGDALAFLVVLAAALVGATAVGRRLGSATLQRLLIIGVLVRAMGSEVRLLVLEHVYNGVGDAVSYLGYGRIYASSLRDFSLGPLMDPVTGEWWGTHFVRVISGLVIFLVGDHFHAASLVFALFGYAGLVLVGLTFRHSFGELRGGNYLAWLIYWPSLWYWPSSIGKDTLMLLGLGLFTYGYASRSQIRWTVVAVGAALTTCIRPHITMSLVAALALSEWFGRGRGKGASGLQLLVVMVVAFAAFYVSLSLFGLGGADLEGIQEEFEMYAERTRKGGSQIAAVSGPLAVPMALVNVLLRPFPWEAHHVLAFASGLEMWGVWTFVYINRKHLATELAHWRTIRLLPFALFATLLISLIYGLAFANMGIIARQRIIILPFVFIPLALRGARDRAPSRSPNPSTESLRAEVAA